MAYIDRDHFIALLERLGSDRDSDVLEAAREIHRTLHEGGVAWNDLLIPDDDQADEFDEEDEDEDDDTERQRGRSDDFEDEDDEDYEYEEDDDDDLPDEYEEPVSDTEQDRALIVRILKEFKVTEDTRDDLNDLKDDIDAGVFTQSDRRYLHALLARLEGQK